MICKKPDKWGRLNAFQKVMLRWSDLHPYNATHTYKVAGPLRLGDLRQSILDSYLAHGLGIVRLSGDGRSFRHEVDTMPEVEVVHVVASAQQTLNEHLSRQLNEPFDRPCCRPFRFSAVVDGSQSHSITVSYDHWVADSVAARLLLRNVIGRYLGLEIAENADVLDLYPGTYRDVLSHRLRGVDLLKAAGRSLCQWNRNRSAWQVAYWSSTQWAVQHQLYQTTPGTVPRLREFARSLGATVNDVILAAMGRAMAAFMPSRGKRREVALGSIVDTRSLAAGDLAGAFGAFLGYYQVRNRPDASVGLDEATRRIAALSQPIKERKRYLDGLINMQVVNTVWPWLPESVKPHFMRKVISMTGGVSNVFVRDRWMDQNRHAILDYHRGAPTGPMVPLVLTPTTLGDQMNIGATCRVAGFSRAKIDGIMAMFLQQIEHPNESSLSRKQTSICSVSPTCAEEPVSGTQEMARDPLP